MSSSEINPYFTGNGNYKAVNPLISSKVGDFTPFYIAIAICSVLLGFLIILNIICCCSRYSEYWFDRHTGNRWIVSIWSATPHKQPALDYSELKTSEELSVYIHQPYPRDYPVREDVPPSISTQPLTSSHEYLELHKRESDI